MKKRFKYNSASTAIDNLREEGFDKDFRLEGKHIHCGDKHFALEDMKIVITHRYEGDSDPADEVTVYGLESIFGDKGILVIADGIYADASSTNTLALLHKKKNSLFSLSI